MWFEVKCIYTRDQLHYLSLCFSLCHQVWNNIRSCSLQNLKTSSALAKWNVPLRKRHYTYNWACYFTAIKEPWRFIYWIRNLSKHLLVHWQPNKNRSERKTLPPLPMLWPSKFHRYELKINELLEMPSLQ